MTSLLGILLGSLGTSSANVPGAPGIGTASRLDTTSVVVPYTAPASDGGSTITKYTAVSTPGGITGILNQAGSGSIIVSGLTTGTSYTFVVYATNSAGNSANSAASNSATPAGLPGTPTIGTATATGTTTATVSFTAPASNGGSTITSYTAVSTPGNITGTLNQAGSGTITVTGLNPNTGYTFIVYATNSAGNSPNSGSSNSITTPDQLYQAFFNAATNTQLYVGVSGSSIAASQNFTVECWGYRLNSGTHNFWSIGTETTGRVQLQATLVEVYGGAFSRSFTAPSINAWHHYALVRNSNAIQLYIDGTARLSAGTYSNALGNTGPVYIGTRSNGNVNRLNGYMSNFRIVIGTAVYTGTFTPPRTNLPAISGTSLLTLQNSTAIDNSGNNRTITNTAVTFSTLSGY